MTGAIREDLGLSDGSTRKRFKKTFEMNFQTNSDLLSDECGLLVNSRRNDDGVGLGDATGSKPQNAVDSTRLRRRWLAQRVREHFDEGDGRGDCQRSIDAHLS